MRTARDLAEEIRTLPLGERRDRARELLEVVKLWLYWEKPVDPPRTRLLRDLQGAESILEQLL